jgi:hypothetical protein
LLLLGGGAISLKDCLFYQNRIAAEEFRNKKGLLGVLLRSQVCLRHVQKRERHNNQYGFNRYCKGV